jgi:hypothetical protein
MPTAEPVVTASALLSLAMLPACVPSMNVGFRTVVIIVYGCIFFIFRVYFASYIEETVRNKDTIEAQCSRKLENFLVVV